MKAHEKRATPRVPYISEILCEGASSLFIAQTSDLSTSGVFIHSKLCLEPHSIVNLRFSVASTQIETAGEVCYSIRHIGMGVRFLDLKPAYHAVIQRLIEGQNAQSEDETIKTPRRRSISSGVEPVDKLLGGLEHGHLYLAHGESAGKSLFGLEFLVEGLRRGEPCALITPQSEADAVRRFARLGYDCVDDVRRRTLLLLTSSDDLVGQANQSPSLETFLRELGPMLDEASVVRIVIDPVNDLLAGAKRTDALARVNELAAWVRPLGATAVLVASDENCEVIDSLKPSVKESFRFGVRETSDRMIRFMAFEKSSCIPDQAVRVDPSRGISLLAPHQVPACVEAAPGCVVEKQPPGDPQSHDFQNREDADSERTQTCLRDSSSLAANLTEGDSGAATSDVVDGRAGPLSEGLDWDAAGRPTPLVATPDEPAAAADSKDATNAFFAMLDELQSFASALDSDPA